MAKQKQIQMRDRKLAQTAGREQLVCDLTPEEHRQRGVEHAEARYEVEKIESEKKRPVDDADRLRVVHRPFTGASTSARTLPMSCRTVAA